MLCRNARLGTTTGLSYPDRDQHGQADSHVAVPFGSLQELAKKFTGGISVPRQPTCRPIWLPCEGSIHSPASLPLYVLSTSRLYGIGGQLPLTRCQKAASHRQAALMAPGNFTSSALGAGLISSARGHRRIVGQILFPSAGVSWRRCCRGGRALWRRGLRDCFVGLNAFCAIPLTPQKAKRAADDYGNDQCQQAKPTFSCWIDCNWFRPAKNAWAPGSDQLGTHLGRQLAVVVGVVM